MQFLMNHYNALRRKVKFLPYFLIMLFLLPVTSCEDDNAGDFVKYAEVAARYMQGEDFLADLFVLVHRAIHDTALINNGIATIDSALVSYTENVANSSATFTFDYGTTGQSAPGGEIRKGQIEAVMNLPFDTSGAVFNATSQNFTIRDLTMDGTFLYINTGETIEGKLKYEIEFTSSFTKNEMSYLDFTTERLIFWESGYDKPEKTINHVFTIPENSQVAGNFYNVTGFPASEFEYSTTITSEFIIRFKCVNPVSEGYFEINLQSESTQPTLLFGEFVDTDMDGCIEKVIIKNSDNYGYPYYL